MIKFNFNQTGGLPLTTETLARMQDAYGVVEGVASMAGNFAIVSGCSETDTYVSGGLVMINGELLEFRPGIKQPSVFIGTEKRQAVFENGEAHEVETVRFCAFGVSAEQFPWANFVRVPELNKIESRIIRMEKLMTPLLDGGILLWNKPANTIPAGWQEVTEFRGRMPLGWNPNDGDFDTVGKVGGEKEHILTESEMPSHSHTFSQSGDSIDGTPSNQISTDPQKPKGKGSVDSAGGGMPHNNMSPYRIVMFIMYIG